MIVFPATRGDYTGYGAGVSASHDGVFAKRRSTFFCFQPTAARRTGAHGTKVSGAAQNCRNACSNVSRPARRASPTMVHEPRRWASATRLATCVALLGMGVLTAAVQFLPPAPDNKPPSLSPPSAPNVR